MQSNDGPDRPPEPPNSPSGDASGGPRSPQDGPHGHRPRPIPGLRDVEPPPRVSLPQNDPSPDRLERLERLRHHYRWDQTSFAPYPALEFAHLESFGALNVADFLIGSFERLPTREHPSLRMLRGRTLSALPQTLVYLNQVPVVDWAAAGLTAHEWIRRQLDQGLLALGVELAAKVHRGPGGERVPPTAAEAQAIGLDRLLEAIRTLGHVTDRRVTSTNDILSVLETTWQLIRGSDASTSARWFAGIRNLLDDLELRGGATLEQSYATVRDSGMDDTVAVFAMLFQTLVRFTARTRERGRHTPRDDRHALDRYIPRPTTPDPCEDDGYFGRMLVAGANPVVIERVRERDGLPERFPVTDEHLRGALRALGAPSTTADSATLEGSIAAGRLYLTDFGLLDGLPCRTTEDIDFFGQSVGADTAGPRYLPAPYGLFHRTEHGLRPVAIQLGRNPTEYEVFTPADDAKVWSKAKMAYLCADANHQQMATHVGSCHLLLAGFAVATARQLCSTHPLSVLLRLHLESVLWTDFLGRQLLVNPRGWFEGVYPGLREDGILRIAARHYEAHPFDDLVFPRSLARRGVEDPSVLPDYPFRDDGLALWEVLRAFIGDYVGLYYRTPEDMTADRELQGWLFELRARHGAHVLGFPADVDTVEALAEVVTAIVFRSSCFHSAVNYSQYEAYGSPDHTPATLRADPRELRRHAKEDFLPGPAPWLNQISLMWVNHTQRDHVLTDYDLSWFGDPRVWPLVVRLRQALVQVEAGIDQRNEAQGYAYDYLRPSLVTMAANI